MMQCDQGYEIQLLPKTKEILNRLDWDGTGSPRPPSGSMIFRRADRIQKSYYIHGCDLLQKEA